MAIHPNSLANLKPARSGEVRNPLGTNQYSLSAEQLCRLDATCQPLLECHNPELRQQLLERVARDIVGGAISGDRQLQARIIAGGIRGLW